MIFKTVLGCFVLVSSQMAAVGQSTVVGAGYNVPTALTVAPGEVMTLYVQGIGSGLTGPVAANTYPLPTSLAGVSVSMMQVLAPVGPFAVPLMAVFPVSTCSTAGTANCSSLVGITLQIPFELVPDHGSSGAEVFTNQAFLTVTENGVSTVIQASTVVDQIHVLRQNDTIFGFGGSITNGQPNYALVTHADGSLVTSGNLAVAGETLVLYAVGLGLTTPGASTGAASPSPPSTLASAIGFDFSPDAGPGWPYAPGILTGVAPRSPAPSEAVFSGLVPGFVGLYQINFVVPPIPSGYLSRCGADASFSNLTISVDGFTSFDGAGICVAVQ